MKKLLFVALGMFIFLSCKNPWVFYESDSEFAKSDSIAQIKVKIRKDSIAKIEGVTQKKKDSIAAILQKKWDKSLAGKIHKKHPTWTKEECELLAERQIWIGMSFDMLKYLKGKPDHANPSNYGSGIRWQWCWDDGVKPSCFYGSGNGIITSYN